MNSENPTDTILTRKEKRKIYNQNYYKSKKEKLNLEKKEVCDEKQKQEDINKILLKKMDELYLKLAQNEILLESLTKNLSVTDEKPSKKSVIDDKPSKKPIKVDVSDDDEPAFNSIPEAHKKLFKTIIKQEAKRNITETTNTMSESEESDSEIEIDEDGNII